MREEAHHVFLQSILFPANCRSHFLSQQRQKVCSILLSFDQTKIDDIKTFPPHSECKVPAKVWKNQSCGTCSSKDCSTLTFSFVCASCRWMEKHKESIPDLHGPKPTSMDISNLAHVKGMSEELVLDWFAVLAEKSHQGT
jgi:hypothetical protein